MYRKSRLVATIVIMMQLTSLGAQASPGSRLKPWQLGFWLLALYGTTAASQASNNGVSNSHNEASVEQEASWYSNFGWKELAGTGVLGGAAVGAGYWYINGNHNEENLEENKIKTRSDLLVKEALEILHKRYKATANKVGRDLRAINNKEYVELTASDQPIDPTEHVLDTFVYPLRKRVDKFISSPGINLMVLLGPSGAGKSSFSRKLEHDLWEAYEKTNDAEKMGKKIPLFISLTKAEKNITLGDGDLMDWFFTGETKEKKNAKRVRKQKNTLTKDHVDALFQSDIEFVVMLDGFEETEKIFNIYDKELAEWVNAKVILNSRAEIMSEQESKYMFAIERDEPPHIYIAPWREQEIDKYLKLTSKRDKEGEICKQYLKQILGKGFAGNPMLIRVAIEAIKSASKGSEDTKENDIGSMNLYELYDDFVEKWFTEEAKRVSHTGNIDAISWDQPEWDESNDAKEDTGDADRIKAHLLAYATDLAIGMYRDSVISVEPKFKTWKRFFTKEVRRLKEGSPIQRVGLSSYKFTTTSVLYYLVARRITDTILHNKRPEFFDQELGQTDPIIVFIANRIKTKSVNLKKPLEGLELQKNDVVKKNMLTASVMVDSNFSGQEHQGKDFSRMDLRNANFQESDLRGANFEAANLQDANFSKADLKGVNFQDADLTNAILPQLALNGDKINLINAKIDSKYPDWFQESRRQKRVKYIEPQLEAMAEQVLAGNLGQQGHAYCQGQAEQILQAIKKGRNEKRDLIHEVITHGDNILRCIGKTSDFYLLIERMKEYVNEQH